MATSETPSEMTTRDVLAQIDRRPTRIEEDLRSTRAELREELHLGLDGL